MHAEILICFDLRSLQNGAISYNGGSTDIRPINTIATHICNTGYTLNINGVSECVRMTENGVDQLQLVEVSVMVIILFVFVEYSYLNSKYPC